MTSQSPPPFRADHVGSLLRPKHLRDAWVGLSSASPSEQQTAKANLRTAQIDAIQDIVQRQIKEGVRPLTDGEFARDYFYDNFFEQLAGFEHYKEEPIANFRSYFPTVTSWIAKGNKSRPARVAVGKIKHEKSPYLDEWLTLREVVGDEALWPYCKMTIPSPTYYHMQLHVGKAYDTSVYANDQAFFADLTAAYRAEIRTLYDAGLRHIQIDDPNMTFFGVESFRQGLEADGVDPDDLLKLYIQVHNSILSGIPPDLTVGIHLCRGNAPNSTSYANASYDAVASIFSASAYRTFYLEFDGHHAGPFAPLRHLPRDKVAVLGLVTTKRPELEEAEAVARRVREAAEVVAEGQGRGAADVLWENLALSPQCGFSSASVAGGVGVTEEVMWRKLRLVREVVGTVWGAE